jgi:hypothetical protein
MNESINRVTIASLQNLVGLSTAESHHNNRPGTAKVATGGDDTAIDFY